MKRIKPNHCVNYPLFLLLLFALSLGQLLAQPCTLVSGNINLGGASHDPGYQSNDAVHSTATLSNGNFVVAWETRDGVDGAGNGAYFQVFTEDGVVVSSVTMPYADINPAGTGDQGAFGPKVIALTSGFVIGWESEDGPGDTGLAGDDQQDVYFRVYNNAGTAISGSTRISVADAEDQLEYLLALSTGGFVALTSIDEDVVGNNTDEYFIQGFSASGMPTSAMVNISGGAHNLAFQTIDPGQPMVDLGNGNYVVSWEARDDIDGDGNGCFFRVFNSSGTAVSGVVMPYADVNAAGTGDQGTPGPLVCVLENGNFVVSWESVKGPGDLGPLPDEPQDIYFRIYSPNGTPVTGSLKANSDNTAEEEHINGIIGLTGGNFAFLYHRDEDDTGNNDDFFVRAFLPSGMPAGPSLEISGGAHLDAFCTVLAGNLGFIALNNGNFAVGWAARDGADGDGDGAYYRVFNAAGAAVSPITMPYADINPTGTGNQSSTGPILRTLADGFTVAWDSEQGPGDVGPVADDQQDVYHRVIDNSGVALCGTIKTNTGNDAEEEILVTVQALGNGNFAVVYRDDEDETGNLDDLFVRVIGGAPLQVICPTMGMATVSAPSVCVGNPFNVMVTGLQNMAISANNEQDFGIKFVGFNTTTSDPYTGGTLLGSVTAGNLMNGGTTASLTGLSFNFANPGIQIYAILDVSPASSTCRPSAHTQIIINDLPTVTFTAAVDICVDAGVQTGLGGGIPTGGTYSGPGVTDDGNGSTFSFNPTAAGVGAHLITYNYDVNGCAGSATDEVEVLALPNVSISLPDTIFVTNGMPPANVPGGGMPVGGVYTDMFDEAMDDGNGLTFSFLSNFLIGDTNVITYTYTDMNGCSNAASKTVFVANATVGVDDLDILKLDVFPNPSSGIIFIQGVVADRIQVIDSRGSILMVENTPGSLIDISALPSGLYFLRIFVEDQMALEQVVKE